MNARLLTFAAVALLGLVAGGLFALNQETEQAATEQAAPAGPVGQPRPPFTLGDIDGQRVSATDFDGRVLLVNFWATWCAPCREEMPMLVDIQERYSERGLSVVGIALDDVQQVREFVQELGVTYTVLVGGADVMATGAVYGNRTGVLPYTVLVDRDGIVRWAFLGPLKEQQLVENLEPLL